jgi:hypothetical protein
MLTLEEAMDEHDGHYAVYWPRAARQVKRRPLAARPPSLEGRTVAQLWDFLFRGDEVFALLEEGLEARFPGVRFVSWREFGNIHGSDERAVVKALPERLRELGADAVITGIAA